MQLPDFALSESERNWPRPKTQNEVFYILSFLNNTSDHLGYFQLVFVRPCSHEKGFPEGENASRSFIACEERFSYSSLHISVLKVNCCWKLMPQTTPQVHYFTNSGWEKKL